MLTFWIDALVTLQQKTNSVIFKSQLSDYSDIDDAMSEWMIGVKQYKLISLASNNTNSFHHTLSWIARHLQQAEMVTDGCQKLEKIVALK